MRIRPEASEPDVWTPTPEAARKAGPFVASLLCHVLGLNLVPWEIVFEPRRLVVSHNLTLDLTVKRNGLEWLPLFAPPERSAVRAEARKSPRRYRARTRPPEKPVIETLEPPAVPEIRLVPPQFKELVATAHTPAPPRFLMPDREASRPETQHIPDRQAPAVSAPPEPSVLVGAARLPVPRFLPPEPVPRAAPAGEDIVNAVASAPALPAAAPKLKEFGFAATPAAGPPRFWLTEAAGDGTAGAEALPRGDSWAPVVRLSGGGAESLGSLAAVLGPGVPAGLQRLPLAHGAALGGVGGGEASGPRAGAGGSADGTRGAGDGGAGGPAGAGGAESLGGLRIGIVPAGSAPGGSEDGLTSLGGSTDLGGAGAEAPGAPGPGGADGLGSSLTSATAPAAGAGTLSAAAPIVADRPQPKVNPADGLEYLWIAPGEFRMGCVPGDDQCLESEKPRHYVRINKGFWISRTEVTVRAYQMFASETGKPMPEPLRFNKGWKRQDHPIVRVSWQDSSEFCRWTGGRLPTEAEWEYAARGGQEGSIFPWDEPGDRQANYEGKGGEDKWEFTSPVGRFAANGYGLHDMAGNVWEWVWDWRDDGYYETAPESSPRGPETGEHRVFRGGSMYSSIESLRISYRGRGDPAIGLFYVGFRCARDVSP